LTYLDIDRIQRDTAGFSFDYGLLIEDLLLANVPRGGLVVELGCFLGCSTVYIAQFLKDHLSPARFYTCDKFQDFGTGGCFYGTYMGNLKACGVRDEVRTIVALSWEVALLFDDREVDFVWVDADHQKASVQKDLEAWWPKVKTPGGLAGHDYSEAGVKEAVDEFAAQHGLEVCVYNPTGWQSWYFRVAAPPASA
jgi:hypothetical protein